MRKPKYHRPIWPLPQVFVPGTWQLKAAKRGGHTCGGLRQMEVPTGDSEEEAVIRAHETAHAAYSTLSPSELVKMTRAVVAPRSLLAAEDGRIAYLGRAVGVETVPMMDEKQEMELLLTLPPIERARRLIAMGQHGFELAGGRINVEGYEISETVCEALSVLKNRADNQTASVDAAMIIDRLDGPPERGGEDDSDSDSSDGVCGDSDCVDCRNIADIEAEAERRTTEAGGITWGELIMEATSLGTPHSERAVASTERSYRAADNGLSPRYMGRMFTDGAVFARRKRVEKGGTVLVDASGSMSLSPGAIADIVRAVPAATIAVYAGSHGNVCGYLRIVAAHGQQADVGEMRSPHYSGGNVVDGPALEWLAQQAGPRIWYCDGVVTGIHDQPSLRLNAQAARIREKAGAVRVKPCDEGGEDDAIDEYGLDGILAALGGNRK